MPQTSEQDAIYFQKRKGYIRLAIEAGKDILPVYHLGQSQVMTRMLGNPCPAACPPPSAHAPMHTRRPSRPYVRADPSQFADWYAAESQQVTADPAIKPVVGLKPQSSDSEYGLREACVPDPQIGRKLISSSAVSARASCRVQFLIVCWESDRSNQCWCSCALNQPCRGLFD